MEWTCNLYKFS